MSEYTTRDIQVLTGVDAVRRRPGMFVGNTRDRTGAFVMLDAWLEVPNAAIATAADLDVDVEIVLRSPRRVSVTTRGLGLPVGDDARPWFDLLLTEMTSDYERVGWRSPYPGQWGIGPAAVCALSSRLVLDNCVDGQRWRVVYAAGVCQAPPRVVGEGGAPGFSIDFELDDAIFAPDASFDLDLVLERIETLAFGRPGTRWTVIDAVSGRQLDICYARGVADYVERIGRRTGSHPVGRPFVNRQVIHHAGVVDDRGRDVGRVQLDIALQPVARGEQFSSFVNLLRTRSHGSHVTGLRAALRAVLNELAPTEGVAPPPPAADVLSLFVGTLALTMPNPEFANRTRDELRVEHIVPALQRRLEPPLRAWLARNPALIRWFCAQLTTRNLSET